MKKAILLLAVSIGIYYFVQDNYLKKGNDSLKVKSTVDSTVKQQQPIRVVFFQDVSGSIKQNGVELITSSVFTPYFNATDRSIEINFGCIENLSAKKLITVFLPAATFSKPEIPDLRTASITDKRKFKEIYLNDLQKFQADSARYFSERKNLIAQFCKQVDSAIGVFRAKLSSETDLVTAVSIADKVFNYSVSDAAKNILILNSDGLDSYNRTVKKLNNKACVYLVNANGIIKTSVDGILTNTFQSSEQAIEISLINQTIQNKN